MPYAITYRIPKVLEKTIQIGAWVQVPLRKRLQVGVVVGCHQETSVAEAKIKFIESCVETLPECRPSQVESSRFLSSYYGGNASSIWALNLPPNALNSIKVRYKITENGKKSQFFYANSNLKPKEAKALSEIDDGVLRNKEQLRRKGFTLRFIERALENGLIEKRPSVLESQRKKSKNIEAQDSRDYEFVEAPYELNRAQRAALDRMEEQPQGRFLIHGVTGSGKTELYIQRLHQVLSAGGSACVVVPEIALSLQIAERIQSRVRVKSCATNSMAGVRARQEAWWAAYGAGSRLFIGPRSILTLPYQSLDLIVVDESHDASLKQDESPRYHGREFAMWLSNHFNAQLILGSATPSIESRVRVTNGHLEKITLNERASSDARMPTIRLVDMLEREQKKVSQKRDRAQSHGSSQAIFSGPLQKALLQRFEAQEQSLLFLNRRGFSSIVLCDTCGLTQQCPNCSSGLTFYESRMRYQCHYCGFSAKAWSECSECREEALVPYGLGTERVENEVRNLLPQARIVRLDRDRIRNEKDLIEAFARVHSGECDVVIGTQMITKGHDFPGVTLTGVIDADLGLAFPDFRAEENVLTNLIQVSGRAGRAEKAGEVIVQSHFCDHRVLQCFAMNRSEELFATIAEERDAAGLAPQYPTLMVRLSSTEEALAARGADWLANTLREVPRQVGFDFVCTGPSPSPLSKIKNRFRFQIWLSFENRAHRHRIQNWIEELVFHKSAKEVSKIRVICDVDPVNLM